MGLENLVPEIRPATPDDYPAFTTLFPELQVNDPLPSLDTWTTMYVPATWVAVSGACVIGYCYCQEYIDTGYVRNVVVAPAQHGKGVATLLMKALAERLRSSGKQYWRLNVKPDNVAALALYTGLGMRVQYRATAFKFPWAALPHLPFDGVAARVLEPKRDAVAESAFDLPQGQLAYARQHGRHLWEIAGQSEATMNGLACFDAKFPGAFPFRAASIQAAAGLLTSIRSLVPSDEFVYLVAEDDEDLAACLKSVGATIQHQALHLKGAL
jgi:ribosomal protein S18 acetylase RimI-like enzyme